MKELDKHVAVVQFLKSRRNVAVVEMSFASFRGVYVFKLCHSAEALLSRTSHINAEMEKYICHSYTM